MKGRNKRRDQENEGWVRDQIISEKSCTWRKAHFPCLFYHLKHRRNMKYFQNEKWTLEEHKQNLIDVVDSLLVMYKV